MPRILIADDDDILVDLVRFQLEAIGHEIFVAEDGVAALAAARDARPDLMILDAMMPMLSGAEVLRALRADEATRDLPVMMLTARKGESDIVSALKAGASDYMTKPFLPQELVTRAEMLLAKGAADNAG